ncbi:hypothetical protein IVA88_23285 [Bradyrhizobium sp. 149]|uniref:tripartite tricarboxylate transporter substrate-binding protein n=1 Tax=Bradyrhizobium sp. 149 TaxID=2782624 RepID=UPI001FFC1465|nr:tripartite tricarboxylate transporter substrate-binding protein [Bradyrhizobium sp. 149]MCK1654343.1 hypothetical protein [Bradyrhizobium sp. 149]
MAAAITSSGVSRPRHSVAAGATLLMAGNAAIVINPTLYAKLPYDPAHDLVAVAQIMIAPNILVVNKDVPATACRIWST